ncbi:tripartite tricarboxylate transporter substrate binding protein [Agrobacterium rubi]|uniref:tripartite tricarboxylate transporter substrate binding protein n=1 Tax=Agrobacterium rubi TaxID=28099 RepID=UPI00157397EA|nr:tripartite tricarboxylate transporter substrate binding protein [Agrobacterium rubi]NTF08921.1 tripartite tricarboxylate transporter substrate binding protein [Agrobacterium rubi]NTF21192.1 tripartite tricarboxylate transporter substrate binding protein [Agrobacterium rubi]NTF28049.1 tripartite tricarboxylate transporter substrate binding protein [Agrobacterium rubi]
MRVRHLVLPLAALFVSGQAAWAEYPEKPIKMLVSYAPGGSTDLTARILAPFIEKYLRDGANIIVENRPGAGGEIGFTQLAEARPDGYTIGFVNTPNILTIPIERKTKFKIESFDLLGNVLDDPGGFSVNKDGPFKTLADLVEYAKKNPNAVTYGTTGVGSDDHLAALEFSRLNDIKMTHVPFPGASAVKTALTGNHITLGSMNIGEAMQATSSGSPFINLGQMGEQRVAIAPDVPTFKEQNYNIISASLRGVGAPAGLPDDVHKRLADAVAKAAADPEFQAQATKIFAPVRYLSPEEHLKAFKDLDASFRKLWADQPWTAQ